MINWKVENKLTIKEMLDRMHEANKKSNIYMNKIKEIKKHEEKNLKKNNA